MRRPGHGLARRLRAARRARGLTQAGVARAVGLQRPAIAEIEAARRRVSSEELYRFAGLYGVTLAHLLGEPGRPRAVPSTAPSPDAAAMAATIARMTRVIVRRFRPERVILFGSHARGTAGPDSDVDLLVVTAVHGSRRRKAAQIGAALHGFRVPKDIVVTTPSAFRWRKDVVGTIERPAVHEGRVLYARR